MGGEALLGGWKSTFMWVEKLFYVGGEALLGSWRSSFMWVEKHL